MCSYVQGWEEKRAIGEEEERDVQEHGSLLGGEKTHNSSTAMTLNMADHMQSGKCQLDNDSAYCDFHSFLCFIGNEQRVKGNILQPSIIQRMQNIYPSFSLFVCPNFPFHALRTSSSLLLPPI